MFFCAFHSILSRDREELRRSASWTLSGIVLPEDRSRGRTKPSLSKRMQSLVESQKRRILVFRNGESSEGVEIVAGRFDEVRNLGNSKILHCVVTEGYMVINPIFDKSLKHN